MIDVLQKAYEQLEDRKTRLLTKLDQYDEGLLGVKPAEHSWSIVQVLQHLNLSEAKSLSYCQKKLLAGSSIPRVSILSKIKVEWLVFVSRTSMKYRMSNAIVSPHEQVSLQGVCVDWFNTRKALANFIRDYPQKYMDSAVYKHPLIGRVDILSMLRIFDAHVLHHEYQVERILSKLVRD